MAVEQPELNIEKKTTVNALSATSKESNQMPGDDLSIKPVRTGSRAFDYIIGGGFERGEIYELSGSKESIYPLLLQTIANIQHQGGTAAFIDVKRAFDSKQAARLGVDVKKLIVSQPNSTRQTLTVMRKLISSGDVSILVLDSGSTPFRRFKMFSMSSIIKKTNTIVVAIRSQC